MEHERYRWKREGLRYVVRAGTGTRVLFRCWLEDTAIRVTTELLTAYLDGHFQERADQSQIAEHGLKDEDFDMPEGRECGACGHWIPVGGSNSCSLDHAVTANDGEADAG
jgi:hypothetical protein